jgi:hypothetical protein
VLSQGAQGLLNVVQVLCPGPAEDDDVIQIDHHERVCEWLQDIIHYPHQCRWSISWDKRHDEPLKEAFFIFEGCLPYIIWFYQNLVIAWLHIDLVEELNTLELIKKIINLGDWVSVLNIDFV